MEQAYRLLPWRPRTQMNISYANSVGPQLQPVTVSTKRWRKIAGLWRTHFSYSILREMLWNRWLFWEVKIISEKHSWSHYTFFQSNHQIISIYRDSFTKEFEYCIKLSLSISQFLQEVSYSMLTKCYQSCIYLIKNTVKTVILGILLQFKRTVFCLIIWLKCHLFIVMIIPVFSVTLSFRNHSNMLIWNIFTTIQ